MKKSILRYFYKILICSIIALFSLVASGQDDTLRTIGPRFGVDLSRFIMIPLIPEIKTFEFSVDYEIKPNLYPFFEAGLSTISFGDTNYSYSGSGIYFRAGIDKNMLELEQHNDYSMGFLGVRYGLSLNKFSAENIILEDPYWGDLNTSISEQSGHNHWIEVAAGIRVEIFKNFFMGWSARGRVMLYKSKFDQMIPYYVPGFGDPSGRASWDINYSIYYKIPIIKR